MSKLKDIVLHGDCLEEMESIEDNSIDSIVDDPPYALGFMGKDWDTFSPKQYQDFIFKVGKQKLRILKPGSYNLSFSGTRTYHRLVCGLEDSGFTIKDMLMWCYGSGYPKGLDISLAIDDYYGKEREIIRERTYEITQANNVYERGINTSKPRKDSREISKPATKEAQKWDGWGTGLKPAFEPIVVAQKPYEGTYAENVLKYGVGGLNIDGCRISNSQADNYDLYKRPISKGNLIDTRNVKNAPNNTIDLKRGVTQKGRFPANLILTHHPECKLVGSKEVKTSTLLKSHNIKEDNRNVKIYPKAQKSNQNYGKNGYDTGEAWQCHPSCPIRMLDEQSGELKSGDIKPYLIKNEGVTGWMKGKIHINSFKGDKGGASRFFYCGKAYKTERNAGCEGLFWKKKDKIIQKLISKSEYHKLPEDKRAKGNPIATLKPINIIRYLTRLITPPNGIILDPFAGSGTTGIASIIEDFHYILIEKRKPFAEIIIPKRLEYWKDPSNWHILNDHNALPKIKRIKDQKQNISIERFF